MNKIMNRVRAAARGVVHTSASAVVLCLMSAVLAQGAGAQEPVKYLAPVYKTVGGITSPTNGIDRWETKSTNVYSVVTKDTATLSAGWWVVDGTVRCTGAITVSGEVHLILKDDASLTVSSSSYSTPSGICVSGDGNSLTVYGQDKQTGTLNSTGKVGYAGIGGNNGPGSNITINGGIVTAKGAGDSAGIGGGKGGSGSGSNITINGGTVKASAGGGAGGAGIGGAVGGFGSNITINGGDVTATGNINGAGIGGGDGASGSCITINGGTVIATANTGEGAGIGGGGNGPGSSITISGGTVTATANRYGAGIGGGNNGPGSSITISGGTVTAKSSGYGAGIGGGSKGAGSYITISGGTVNATGGGSGTGIGGGDEASGSYITISGGTVTATGGEATSYSPSESSTGIGKGLDSKTPAKEIRVAAHLTVMADNNNPPTTEITHTADDDISGDLSGKRYVKVASMHTIYLAGGRAHLDTASGDDVTDEMSSKGLSYSTDTATWTMSNFVFTTTAATALEFADSGTEGAPANVTVKVEGANTITGGDSSKDWTVGLFFAGKYANVTISGSGAAESKLAVTAGATTASGNIISAGLYLAGEGQTLMLVGLTADFNGANAPLVSVGVSSANGNVTVGDGAEVFSAGLSASGVSVASGILMDGSSNLKIEGTGKLVAKCAGEGAGVSYAVAAQKEPDAKAVVTGTGTALAYDMPSKTYKDAHGNIATNITLTAKVMPLIPFEVTAPAGATAAVYTNGVAVAAGETIFSNCVAEVVYTVTTPGQFFENGEAFITNTLNTAVDPAVDTSAYVPKAVGTPSVQLGIVAQRYPWNGILDIQYKTPYANAAKIVTFKANGIELGTAPGTGGQAATASIDLNAAADGAFKEKALKNVKITATIE